MAETSDLPRFIISKVEEGTRSQEAQQQPANSDDKDEGQSTDTPVNGNVNYSHFTAWSCNNTPGLPRD